MGFISEFQNFVILLKKVVATGDAHFTEPADDVGDEEGTPAEEEDSHDDPHRDGGLVLLHQAVADVVTGGGPGQLDHLGGPPLNLLLDHAGLHGLGVSLGPTVGDPGEDLSEGSSELMIDCS